MPRHIQTNEIIDRVVIKIPHSLAAYFRKAFRHGQRSEFVADCIRRFKKEEEMSVMDEELRAARDLKRKS